MKSSIDSILNSLWSDAIHLLDELGKAGGLMSGSVYDTARVLRYYPPRDSIPAIDWLVQQQASDGAWTTPEAPRGRYMPTVAALIALQTSGDGRTSTSNSIDRGVNFLAQHQHGDWRVLGDDLPGGVELILPRLIAEAREVGLAITPDAYQGLEQLGNKRRQLIRRLGRLAGTTATHVWEGWGVDVDCELVDGSNTVGHSPAASALWWSLASNSPERADERRRVQDGLEGAWAATTTNIPGVICSCWPITHFERAFSLYPFALAGYLAPTSLAGCPPQFQSVVSTQVKLLQSAMTNEGLGFSDWFLADGDDTAVAIAVLTAADLSVDWQIMAKFLDADSDHFCAWRGEIQSSPTVTAHGLHALCLANASWPLKKYCDYLLRSRLENGMWAGEKWNVSPIYTTSQILVALLAAGAAKEAIDIAWTLANFQQVDGGWGMRGSSSEETAYAILALLSARRANVPGANFDTALVRARDWMCENYRPFAMCGAPLWLGKETYRPLRISRAFEIAAMIAILQEFKP